MKKLLPAIFILFSCVCLFGQEVEDVVVELVESTPEEIGEDGPSRASGTTVEEPGTTVEGPGTMVEEPGTTVEETPLPEKNPLTLPLAEREEIERFRKQYLDPKWTQVLYNALENAIDYRLDIRKELEEQGLPPELEYLPVVEAN